MVPKPAFCSILHENVVFAVFLARWLAGTVCKPANSQEFMQQTYPQGGAGYHCSIYILNLSTLSLRYLIWSSFQYLILAYILVTYISIHACLAWNQFSSSYPTSYIAVGWRLADASPFPGPTHSTGGGGLMGYDHDHGRGGGGGPGTWNIYTYCMCHIYFWALFLGTRFSNGCGFSKRPLDQTNQ